MDEALLRAIEDCPVMGRDLRRGRVDQARVRLHPPLHLVVDGAPQLDCALGLVQEEVVGHVLSRLSDHTRLLHGFDFALGAIRRRDTAAAQYGHFGRLFGFFSGCVALVLLRFGGTSLGLGSHALALCNGVLDRLIVDAVDVLCLSLRSLFSRRLR